ncbi:MAG: alpha/beta hydrolase [Janthinobacterium lividum]
MLRFCLLTWFVLQAATTWAIRPVANWWAKPDTLGLAYQPLTLTTPDHLHLAAWLIAPAAAAPNQHTTLVIAGGDAGNMAGYLYEARAFTSAGYQVLLFDYRGFGHSDAYPLDLARLYYQEFATDLRTALREARRLAPRHQRVGILGYSMGSLLGAQVAAITRCDFLLTEGYVGNPQATVARIWAKSQKLVTLPAEAAAYARVAPHVNCPWLLIAGTEDQKTPLADSAAAVQAARPRQRRQLLSVKCDHLGAAEVLTSQEYGDAYVQAVSRFLAGGQAG